MKLFCTAFLLFIFLPSIFCQDKLPAFGKIEKSDLEMTSCSFDPDAEAMYLIDKGEVNYSIGNGGVYLQTDQRTRIKILKEEGIQRADIKFSYYSKDRYEEISNLEGFVYNLDASGNIITTKLDKSAFFNKPINDKYSQISIAFPQVKVGTVIEFKYKSYKKSIAGIKDWYFQSGIPSRYSEYTLYIPEYFDFTSHVTRRQEMESKITKETSPGYMYIMRNVPALKQEPYMSGYRDYVQRVEFQLAAITPPGGTTTSYRTTWEKLIEELQDDEYFGGQIKRNISHVESLTAALKGVKDTLEKVKTIYRFVQKNVDFNGQESKYAMDGVKECWDKKSGTSGQINLLLINLLKDNGVKAYPILVSTKDNGKVNTFYPFLDQFNEVMAYVVIADNIYVLNASDKYNPYFLIPYDVQATKGFVVDKKIQWLNLTNLTQKFKHSIGLHADVDSNGIIRGEAFVSSSGYARNVRMNTFKKGKINEVFTSGDIKADTVEVKNEDIDTLSLDQKITFSGKLEKSDGYYFLPYNLFTGMVAKNPFTADKRQSDIDFSYVQQYLITGSFSIPEGFAFEEHPKNMTMIMPDTSIILRRIFQVNDNTVSFRITLDFKKPDYTADDYLDVKEYFKKMYAVLDEKIVVKKK